MTVADARAAMLAAVRPLGTESTSLEDGLGRVLAQPVVANRALPPFIVSAMDGYALRSADTPGTLRVAGESAAGHGYDGRCGAGEAIRISTGAALPAGADTVIIQEDVARDGDVVTVPAGVPGKNIRPQGGDFVPGTTLLEPGRRLDGIAISLAAAAGLAALSCARRPRVAILSSGDELAAPGTAPGRWQIFDSATFALAALVRSWGGAPHRLAVEKDNLEAIARAARQGLEESDLLVVLGGASVGDHDHARPALLSLGLNFVVEKVSVRPGKPTWFGTTPHAPVLGLPGNPASALVCAHLFLRPLIAAMLGADAGAVTRTRKARLAHSLPANGAREHYLRARLSAGEDGQLSVRAYEDQDSSLLSVFAAANALIRLEAGAPALSEGALVDTYPLGDVAF